MPKDGHVSAFPVSQRALCEVQEQSGLWKVHRPLVTGGGNCKPFLWIQGSQRIAHLLEKVNGGRLPCAHCAFSGPWGRERGLMK